MTELNEIVLGSCLVSIKNGVTITQHDGCGGIPITRIETLSNGLFNRSKLGYADIFDTKQYKDYVLDDGDLLMSHINSRTFLGRTVQYHKIGNEQIIHGMNLLRIKTNPLILDATYAYYLFQSPYFKKHIDCIRKDAINQSSIAISDIQQLKLLIHDLSTQKRIASVLSNIDRKIALNRAMNEELEAMAKQLYDYWFLQFDFPDANGKPYRSSGGKMVYNNQLKREIPEGWCSDNICKVADILSGGTPSKSQSQFWNGNILFFGPTDYKNQMFQLNTKDKITEVGLNKCASSLYEEGVIIITARGSIGKLVICGRPMAMNQSCYALRSLKGEYQYLYFLSQDLIKYLKIKGSGSTFDSIIASDIKASYFPIPHPNLITEFCKIVNPWFEHIKNNSMEIDHLRSLRNELLPLLMNGQVEVKE